MKRFRIVDKCGVRHAMKCDYVRDIGGTLKCYLDDEFEDKVVAMYPEYAAWIEVIEDEEDL